MTDLAANPPGIDGFRENSRNLAEIAILQHCDFRECMIYSTCSPRLGHDFSRGRVPKMTNILQDRKSYSVEVTATDAPYQCSPGIWSLFANYPSELEAYQALDRAKAQGYRYARIIIETTFDLLNSAGLEP